MATVRLQPPEQFDFKNPDGWNRWKRRFEQFRVASGLSQEDEKRQVSTLLYCMGEDAESVLTSTGISDTDKEKYKPVASKLDEFFKVRKNTMSAPDSIAEISGRASRSSSTSQPSMNLSRTATTAT